MRRQAVFLDRDGTLVYARHYPTRPEHLKLYEGIGRHLARLQTAGFLLVVVTNQSGIARGLFSEADLGRMHAHLRERLAAEGVRLDGLYHCPHHPEGVIHELAVACDCRKPGTGMVLRASRDLDIDLRRSWFVGDILDDVEAGKRSGCRAILVDLGTESPPTTWARTPDMVAQSTEHALRLILAAEGLGPHADYCYLPPSWRTAPSEGLAV